MREQILVVKLVAIESDHLDKFLWVCLCIVVNNINETDTAVLTMDKDHVVVRRSIHFLVKIA